MTSISGGLKVCKMFCVNNALTIMCKIAKTYMLVCIFVPVATEFDLTDGSQLMAGQFNVRQHTLHVSFNEFNVSVMLWLEFEALFQ